MKKLLLVLMVVALASFLFVGCFPTTPAEGEGEGEGEAELCPAVTLSGGVDVAGKLYVKAGKAQTITITFGTVTEPVNLFVGPCNEKAMPTGVPESSAEVILRTTDKKVYTGTYKFSGECCELYLYLMYSTGEVICKYPVIVDGEGPYAKIKVKVAECPCEDCAITFTSDWTVSGDCEDTVGCCDDDCSGFASWAIDIYDEFPFDDCCSLQCATPADSGSGTACPVDFTTKCLEADEYWVIINLADKVGNETRYIASLEFDEDCEVISGTEYDEANICEDCIPSLPMDGFIGACDTDPVEWLGCEEAELEVCPVVTFVPATPIVGQETTITIDFTGKQTPAGIVSAYVGPSIKTLPLGVPEDAQELVLTKDGVVYTALYTFGQAGTDYIYVTLGCEDCTPCKTAITVDPAPICPEVEFLDDTPFAIDGIPVYALAEDVNFTVTFADAIEKELVKVYVGLPGLGPIVMPIVMPPTVLQVAMTTADEQTYEGTIPVSFIADLLVLMGWDLSDEMLAHILGCVDLRIYVLAGDPCCIEVCEYPFIVDPVGPYAALEVIFDTCEIYPDDCWPDSPEIGYYFSVSTIEPDDCDPPTVECCGDTCSGLKSWELHICMCDPYDDCGEWIGCEEPIDCEYVACSGTVCPVECEGPCEHEDEEMWKHSPFWLYVKMTDNAGNITEYKEELHYNVANTPEDWDVGFCIPIVLP